MLMGKKQNMYRDKPEQCIKIEKNIKRQSFNNKSSNKSLSSKIKKTNKILMHIQSSDLQLRSKFFILFLAFSISAGAFVMGYALVGTGLLQEYIQTYNNLSKQEIHYYLSIIITLLPLGAIVGSLLCSKLVNSIGQKNSMILVDVMMAVALIAQSVSLDLHIMYITRFIFGFFCGVSSTIIPPYLTSISPLNMTGFIGSFNQLLITIGISIAYAMNFFLQSSIMAKQFEIAIFILVPLPFCLIRIGMLTLIFPYDTAESHFQRKQFDAVHNIMDRIYYNANYDEYCRGKNLSEYQKVISKEKQSDSQGSQSKILTPLGKRRIILLAIVIAIANQMCGINAIFFYAKQLFTNLTNNDQDSVKKDLFGLGIFQVLMTFVSAFFLDRFGRRFLMLLGLSIVVFSLISAYVATDVLNLASGVVVFFIFLHIFGFSISLGPVCGIYASQIMQDISLVLILMWSLTLVVAMVSDLMINGLGIGKTFLIFGISSLGCLIYFFKEMIQSKGLNRTQLESKFSHDNSNVRIDMRQELQQLQQISTTEH